MNITHREGIMQTLLTDDEYNTLPPHMQRVVYEYEEVQIKYLKLGTYIEAQTAVTPELIQLIKQYLAMEAYIAILLERIETSD